MFGSGLCERVFGEPTPEAVTVFFSHTHMCSPKRPIDTVSCLKSKAAPKVVMEMGYIHGTTQRITPEPAKAVNVTVSSYASTCIT